MFQVIKDFGPGGLATDRYEENAAPAQWTVMDSVDLVAGDLASPGQDIALALKCPIQPQWMFAYTTDQTDYLFVTDGNAVWATSGGEWTMVFDGWSGGLVTFTVFLGSLIINSATNGPYYWSRALSIGDDIWGTPNPPDNTDPILNVAWQDQGGETWNSTTFSTLLRLPGWFADATCLQIIAYKNFLVAIAVRDPARSNDIYPYLICWSDAAPAGGVPGTWEPLPDNLAGDTLAQDTSGGLSGAELMRDDVVIYKTDGQVYRLTYVGGLLVMQLQRLYQGFGVPYPGAIVNLSDVHYLTTRSGIMAFDGQRMVELDFGRIQESVRSIFTAGRGFISHACAYTGRKQVWIAYKPSVAASFFGVLKYDIAQNCFTVHTYSGDSFTAICSGRIGNSFSDINDTWVGGDDIPWMAAGPDSWAGGNAYSWDYESTLRWLDDGSAGVPTDAYDSWDRGVSIPLGDTVFTALGRTIVRYDPRGKPLRHDGTPKRCKVERYGIRLSDNTNRCLIRGLYPMAEGSGVLKFSVGKSWAPWQHEGPQSVQWGNERTFTPGYTREIPMRLVGDSFALRITSDDGESWVLGGIGVEYDQLGLRG